MSVRRLLPKPRPEPVALYSPLDNARFTRETMERAASFTPPCPVRGVAMGVTAFGAAAVASHQSSPDAWFGVRPGEAPIAIDTWPHDPESAPADDSTHGRARMEILSERSPALPYDRRAPA